MKHTYKNLFTTPLPRATQLTLLEPEPGLIIILLDPGCNHLEQHTQHTESAHTEDVAKAETAVS